MSASDPPIEDLARSLWGDPNGALSTREELRYGTNGSKSLKPKERIWYDHETGEHGGYLDMHEKVRGVRPPPPDDTIAAIYDYEDARGALLYQVVRKVPKRFLQRAPDGTGGWSWSTKGIRKVPYRLPHLVATPRDVPVYLAEGEKDCDRLAELGFVATTNPGGAGKWLASMSSYLRDRDVVVLPDNDDAGRQHAADLHRKLTGIANSIRIVELPHLPEKGDVSDWLANGGSAHALLEIVREAPLAGAPTDAKPVAEEAQPRAPAFTDEALALEFTGQHGDRLRYVATWGKWLLREPTVWRFEETMMAFDLARGICRAAASKCENVKVASIVASAKTVAAVERLAKADRRHAATVDQWDSDPWALNTPGGMINLKTGNCRPHDASDHVTKLTAVAAGGECPQWLKFLSKITADEANLQSYLQRAAGYVLTGVTTEHALFFGYGTGGNGKGVFLNTLTAILGGYATVAQMETFTASQHERHPTDLAMLRGARLVTAQETEEGRNWAEARVKALTGGDPVTARFMRQDFFTFVPAFKLFIIGNHKPGIRNVDEALRRRLHLIPFDVQIPKTERDVELFEKLKPEWPGILAWMLEGCCKWLKQGLNPPPTVLRATDTYLESEDSFGLWRDECCTCSGYGVEGSTELFKSWMRWCKATGENAGSQKRFAQTLQARGFQSTRLHDGKSAFRGIYLKAARVRTEPGEDFDDDGR